VKRKWKEVNRLAKAQLAALDLTNEELQRFIVWIVNGRPPADINIVAPEEEQELLEQLVSNEPLDQMLKEVNENLQRMLEEMQAPNTMPPETPPAPETPKRRGKR
jgi:hypothetical protein